MKKILLTGFGIFGSNTVNPTESVVKVLSMEECISSLVLPVVYDRCAEETDNRDEEIFLHLGLAASRNVITVEEYAYNEKRASCADNDGVIFSGERIIENGEEVLRTPFNTDKIVIALENAGIESRVSTDPGRYVCNNVYYHSLAKGRKALFVHLPPFEKLPPDNAVRAVRTVIRELRRQA